MNEQSIDADGDLVLQRRRSVAQGPRERGDDDLVLSEVHMDSLRPAAGEAAASTFRFPAPSPLDAAGSTGSIALTIRHAMATPLRSVGLQVWRGALLLADLLLQRGPAALAGATALELGAGPGLAGLVLSRLAGTVFLTDAGVDVLSNCQLNADLNRAPPKLDGGSRAPASVLVRQLDWLDPPDWLLPPPPAGQQAPPHSDGGDPFAWRPEDLAALQRLDVLLAADCVYDDVLTESFMRCATLLMRYARRHSGRSPRLLVGLERRVVFTLTDREAPSAPAYEYWRTLFREVAPPAAAADSTVHCQAGIASLQQQQRKQQQEPFPLTGWRLDVGGVPQALQPSQRSEELELWELTLSE